MERRVSRGIGVRRRSMGRGMSVGALGDARGWRDGGDAFPEGPPPTRREVARRDRRRGLRFLLAAMIVAMSGVTATLMATTSSATGT